MVADPGLISLLPQNNPLFPAPPEQCFLTLPFTEIFLIPCCNLSPLFITLSSTTGKSIPMLHKSFLCAALHPFISLETTPSIPACRHFLPLQLSHCCPLGSLHPSMVPKTGQNLQLSVVRGLLQRHLPLFNFHGLTQSGAAPHKPNPGLLGWY